MSLWGKSDSVYSTGTVTVDYANLTVTGSGTTFSSSGLIETGDVITFAGNGGSAVITGITSDLQISIASTSGLSGAAIATTSYNINESPTYLTWDTNWDGNEIYGVDTTEVSIARTASGNARKYAPAHAGWVGVTTYVDMHGTLRVKSEVFVAGSSITSDAADDAQFPDS